MRSRWKLTIMTFIAATGSMLLYTAIGGHFDLNAALVFIAIWAVAVLAIARRERRRNTSP